MGWRTQSKLHEDMYMLPVYIYIEINAVEKIIQLLIHEDNYSFKL